MDRNLHARDRDKQAQSMFDVGNVGNGSPISFVNTHLLPSKASKGKSVKVQEGYRMYTTAMGKD